MKELICIDQHILSLSNLLDRYSNSVKFEEIVYLNLHNNEIKNINELSFLRDEELKYENNSSSHSRSQQSIQIFKSVEIFDLSSNQISFSSPQSSQKQNPQEEEEEENADFPVQDNNNNNNAFIPSHRNLGFQYLSNLRKLNLSTNNIYEVKPIHFQNLYSLESINLNFNFLENLDFLSAFLPQRINNDNNNNNNNNNNQEEPEIRRFKLRHLYLIGNKISDINELKKNVGVLKNLTLLNLETKFKKYSNPVCTINEDDYYHFVFNNLFQNLKILDQKRVKNSSPSHDVTPSPSKVLFRNKNNKEENYNNNEISISPTISSISDSSSLDPHKKEYYIWEEEDAEKKNIRPRKKKERNGEKKETSSFLKKFNILNSELENLRNYYQTNQQQPQQPQQQPQNQPQPQNHNQQNSELPPQHNNNNSNNRSIRKKDEKKRGIEKDKLLMSRIISLKKNQKKELFSLQKFNNSLLFENGKLKSFIKFLETKNSDLELTNKKLQIQKKQNLSKISELSLSPKKSTNLRNLNQLKRIKFFQKKHFEMQRKISVFKNEFVSLQSFVSTSISKIPEFLPNDNYVNQKISFFVAQNPSFLRTNDKNRFISTLRSLKKEIRVLKNNFEILKITTYKNFSIFLPPKNLMSKKKNMFDFINYQIHKKGQELTSISENKKQLENHKKFSKMKKMKDDLISLKNEQRMVKSKLFNFLLSFNKESNSQMIIFRQKLEQIMDQKRDEITTKSTQNFEKLKSLVTESLQKESLLKKIVMRKNENIKTLQHDLNSIIQKFERIKEINSRLSSKNMDFEKLKKSNLENLEKKKVIESSVIQKDQRILKLESENKRILGKLEKYESELEVLRKDNNELKFSDRKKQNNIKSIFNEFENEMIEKNNQIKILSSNNFKIKKKMASLLQHNQKLKQKMGKLREHNLTQNKLVEEDKNNELEKWKTTEEELNQKVQILKQFISKHEEEIEDIRIRNKAEVEEIKNEEYEKYEDLRRDYKRMKNTKIENEEKIEYLEDKLLQESKIIEKFREEHKKFRMERNLLISNLKRKDDEVRKSKIKIENLKKMI